MDKRAIPALLALACVIMAATVTAGEAREPGDTFRDCLNCPEMVVLPAGAFVMGTDRRYKYERPAHRVTLGRPFALGKFEITFEEWGACFDDGGCGRMPDDHKWGRDRRPVINITWNDAKTYVEWLSAKTGKTYRLPTDAEWEYAARAGTTTEFFWGDEVGKNLANCRDCGSEWSKKGSAPVGSFAPNPFGSTTCTATSGNGSKTAGPPPTRVRPPTAGHGWTAIAEAGSCAADHGITSPRTHDRPGASRTTPGSRATASACGWSATCPERGD